MTSSVDLTSKQRKHLARLGTQLKPVVTVGKDGVSDAVLASLEQCFNTRELVKARIRIDDATERKAVAAALAERSGSALVQVLGKNALIFRRAEPDAEVEERIELEPLRDESTDFRVGAHAALAPDSTRAVWGPLEPEEPTPCSSASSPVAPPPPC